MQQTIRITKTVNNNHKLEWQK